jgi:hypothetical protein
VLKALGGVGAAELRQPLDAGADAGLAVGALTQAHRRVLPQVRIQQAAQQAWPGTARAA